MHAEARPTVVDLVSLSTATFHLGMFLEYLAFSLRLGKCPENHTFIFGISKNHVKC